MQIKNPYRYKSELPMWNPISGGVYDTVSLYIGGEELTPWNLCFSTDETQLYITGNTADTVKQWSGTPGTISSYIYTGNSFSFSAQTTQPFNIRWSFDGSKCYAVGRNNHTIWQYDAGTNWDISTLVYSGHSLILSDTSNTFTDMIISDDNSIIVTITQATGNIHRYDLSDVDDVSTGVLNVAKSGSDTDLQLEGMFSNPNGKQCYIVESGDDLIRQWDLSEEWNFSELPRAHDYEKDVTAQTPILRGVAILRDGSKFFTIGSTNDTIYQYSL